MDRRSDYLDVDLAVTRVAEGFEVRVLDSPAGETGAVRTTFDDDLAGLALDDVVLGTRSSLLERGLRPVSVGPAGDVEARIGDALFQAVFVGDVLARLEASSRQASADGRAGLRLVLRFGGGADVFPWELLRAGNRFLAVSSSTLLVRCIEMPSRVAPPRVDGPLRILLVVSAPVDLPPIDATREQALLTTALSRWTDAGALDVVVVEPASLDQLRQELARLDVHVFHYIGHGTQLADGTGVLALTGADGRAAPTSADQLATVLADASSLRLAVLNACHGAAGAVSDPFASVAANLVKAGVPAVVAMTRTIKDDAAIVFAKELYEALTRGERIDRAVTEGRRALYGAGSPDWSTVALYLGSSLEAPMMASPLSKIDEDVQFTISRPTQLRAATWEPMLVFTHHGQIQRGPSGETVDQPGEVAARIGAFFGKDRDRVSTIEDDADHALPRGSSLVVVPEIPDVECDPPRASITWTGEIEEVRFLLRAAAHLVGLTAAGWLRVFCGPIMIAETALTMPVVDVATPVPADVGGKQPVPRFRRIFPCFAPEDAELVAGLATVAQSLGDRYLAGVIDGQRDGAPGAWMLPQITEADVFQLFWSSNSMNSAACQQQWETALQVPKPDFIRPLYWEQPFPRAAGRPPPELEALHFVRVPGDTRAPVEDLWPTETVRRPPPPPMAEPSTSVGHAPAPPMPAGRAQPPTPVGRTPAPQSAPTPRIVATLLVVAAVAVVAAVLLGAGSVIGWALITGLAVASVALIVRPLLRRHR